MCSGIDSMIKRIVEITRASWISLKDRQLVVEQDSKVVAKVPIEDLGILLLAHPANVITQQALMACQQADVAVVLCDEKYLPLSLILPLAGSTLHTATLLMQIKVKPQTTRALWRDIVIAKISAQSRHLAVQGKKAKHLEVMALRVSEEDAGGKEAQAAAYYWRELLGPEFRRDKNGKDINALFNYGYAILRACVARAIVGTGLHPALGIFHHNRSDNFALANDLMEPFRPLVDWLAMKEWNRGNHEVDPASKRVMLEALSGEVSFSGQSLPLWVAMQRYAHSVKLVLSGDVKAVEVPIWHFSADTEPCG